MPPLPDPLPDRIHYGCGLNVFDGWLNVDALGRPLVVRKGAPRAVFPVDLTGQQPFPTGAFRFAYAEDFLEHLTQADALTFLIECHRVLQPGGVLRLSFPGLVGVLERHYSPPDTSVALRGKRDAYTNHGHHHFFSLESITTVALHMGYSAVTEAEYGASEHQELRNLERRHRQIGLNLNVELTR